MWSGLYVNISSADSGNSSISIEQLFPGQYNNTKYRVTLSDPDGLGEIRVNKADGSFLMGGNPKNGNPPCLTSVNTGTVTLQPSDFPLRGVIKDCKDIAISYDVQALFPGLYPVTELGNCANQQECKAYCSVSSNYSKCAVFAQKNNMTAKIPDDKKAVFAAMQKGDSPGQCKDEASCRAYCEDIDNIEECVNFVEKFNLASSDELKEIRQMANVKKAGVAFPGNCKTKESCLKYCDNSANAVVCMEFALEAGFIPKEDAESVGKIIPYLKSGGKLPGGCTTKESCDTYCDSESHFNECADFALGAGFMTKEEAEILKKTGGKGPGNCRSKEVCENYCKDEKHIDECVDFAVKAGFISQKEADDAKKHGITSGPGGCKNKAECEAFCITNQDICFEFAKEHGMLSEEDLKNIEQQKEFMKSLDTAPPEWLACMEKELGSEFFVRFKAHKFTQAEANSPAMQAAQRKCGEAMGQDIRKEIEVCLGKATCDEFNSCFDALPKGNNHGNQQSSGQGQQQGPHDENGKKIEARVRACLDEKMDTCLGLSCSEFESCLKSLSQGGGEQSGQQGTGDQGGPQQGQGKNVKFNAKMKVCQEELKGAKTKEVQTKMDVCLDKSCSEFDACIKSVQQGDGQQGTGDQGQEQGQGTPDPKIEAKAKVCQQEKVNACLAKPCSEFQACLNSLGGGGTSGGEQQGTPDPAIQSKFMTCFPPPPQNQDGGSPGSLLMEKPFLGAILRFLFK